MTYESATVAVDEVVDSLAANGFCIISGVLTPQEVEAARRSLARPLVETSFGESGFDGHRTRRVRALFAKTRAFDGPAIHPLVLGVLDRILGSHYQLSAPMAIEIEPGEVAQVLHQDQGLYPVPSEFPEIIVNTLWSIDQFTVENGATRIIPGSHMMDRKPDETADVAYAAMPPGSLLILLGRVWHGAGANKSKKPRLGVILEYQVSWLRPQETHLLAVPQAVVAHLPAKLQELLGYNVYPPAIGLVDGRHPLTILQDGIQSGRLKPAAE